MIVDLLGWQFSFGSYYEKIKPIGRRLTLFAQLKKVATAQRKEFYKGMICDICHVHVKGGQKASHIQEFHPEYAFNVKHVNSSIEYICSQCGMTLSLRGLQKHYQTYHSSKVAS